jgi:hypothetical protein
MRLRYVTLAAALVTPAAAQSINIDFGPPNTGPPASYRAAGIEGTWNSFEAIDPAVTYPLLDVNGLLTGATLKQFGGTEIVQADLADPGDPSGGDRTLLRDAMVTHTMIESCLFINGLQNGTYEVTTYAWMPTAPSTKNNVHVDDPDFPNPGIYVLVGGAWLGEHEEEVTYARHIREVQDGFLGPHSGVPLPPDDDFATGAALNGIQVRFMTPDPPLYMSDDQLQWLAALNAIRYDVVRGDLAALRGSGGDFTVATDGCIAENLGATALSHTGDTPPSGSGFWYLVRGVAAAGNLSYDAPGDSQVGLRDAEIDASPVSCN